MNAPIYNMRPQRPSAIPDVIFVILVINGLMFALQQFKLPTLTYFLALWPFGMPVDVSYEQYLTFWPRLPAPFQPWQLVTYAFLHADIMHLAFNMFMLWMFGREVESALGTRRFLILFLTGVVGAAFVQLIVASMLGQHYPTIGASGGVYALLLGFGLLFPNRMVMLLFPPIPMRALTMVILFGFLEFFFGISGMAPGVANFAHLGGMLFGFLLLLYWGRRRRRN